MTEQERSLTAARTQADLVTALREEFPQLWEMAERVDGADALGRYVDPLWREAEALMREVWMARMNLKPIDIEATG